MVKMITAVKYQRWNR